MSSAKAFCMDFGSSSATRSNPALAGALGNFFGVALVLAVMKIAEAQPMAGWAVAAGAVFLLVLAFGCVDDGHRDFCVLPG
jgi:hypothetical protein